MPQIIIKVRWTSLLCCDRGLFELVNDRLANFLTSNLTFLCGICMCTGQKFLNVDFCYS